MNGISTASPVQTVSNSAIFSYSRSKSAAKSKHHHSAKSRHHSAADTSATITTTNAIIHPPQIVLSEQDEHVVAAMVAAAAARSLPSGSAASADADAPIAVGIPERFITNSAALPGHAAASDAAATAAAETRAVAAKPTAPRKPATKRPATTPAAAKQPATATTPASTAAVKLRSNATALAAAPAAAAAAAAPIVHKIQRARGVLYGLSTLQRLGNVRVQVAADRTTVKSHFRLGPLQLKVEKAFGRGAKRELKSATATTTEMLGRITLRIVNGAATLHSIKVQQPRQLLVTAADDHDRTRAFVWRKSAHIAEVVGEQLRAAARSMLEPAPMAAEAAAAAGASAVDDEDDEEML